MVNLNLRHPFELWCVQLVKTTPYSHEENGVVERVNKEVMRHLRNILFNVKILEKWDEFLPYAERIINATKHSETGFRPVVLLFGNSIDLNRHMTYVPEMSSIEYATPETKEQWEAWMQRRIEQRDTLLEAAKAAQEANIEKQR